jgi:hypothetical protein
MIYLPEKPLDFRPLRWGLMALLLVWTINLASIPLRAGGVTTSFIHLPLLFIHEAGHTVFSPFGAFMHALGGTLGQCLPLMFFIGVFVGKNHDSYAAGIGTWLLGISLMDVAPYMFDAHDPIMMLTSGQTGEVSDGHDWINLFGDMGLLAYARAIGRFTLVVGVLTAFAGLLWSAATLYIDQQTRH